MCPLDRAAPKTIVVIGGGISGLSCAWRLRKLGLPTLLLERTERFGGVITTREIDGFRFDIGPQSFLAGESLLSLIAELNLTGELLKAPHGSPRYIYYRGRLVQAPFGPLDLLRTPLIGAATKLRLIIEPFRRSHPPAEDESIAAFVRRKFGADLLANLVAPFVSGVYAGDPEKLSLRSALPAVYRYEQQYGSVIRGAIRAQREGAQSRAKVQGAELGTQIESSQPAQRERESPRAPLCNFAAGVTALTEALGNQLGACARRGVEILSIRPRSTDLSAAFEVTCRQDGVTQSRDAAAIVLATPAEQSGQLLAGVAPQFAGVLNRIEYAGVAQVSAGYRVDKMSPPGLAQKDAKPDQSSHSLDGFGFLVPRAEGLRVLGTVWNSALFPGRVPDGQNNLGSFTSFLGGATDPELAHMDEQEIAKIARADFARTMGTGDAPAAEHVSRWTRAIPQYNLGHARIVTALKELCETHPGIFLAGNYLAGPAIGACVDQSNETAAAVARFVVANA